MFQLQIILTFSSGDNCQCHHLNPILRKRLGHPALDSRSSWLAPLPPIPSDEPISPSSKSTIVGKASVIQSSEHFPLWTKATIRMGIQFLRVAASNKPAAAPYYPRDPGKQPQHCSECGESHPSVMIWRQTLLYSCPRSFLILQSTPRHFRNL